jgi:hypothetical protein
MHFNADSTFFSALASELARGYSPAEIRQTEEPFNAKWVVNDRNAPVMIDGAEVPIHGVTLISTDPWLIATWNSISRHKSLQTGWDGHNAPAPDRNCLDAAESLANLLSAKPMSVRPQFAVDSDGRPNFATNTKDLYLHLTIEEPNLLSWYAVRDDVEYFEDDVVFDHVSLPRQLSDIF